MKRLAIAAMCLLASLSLALPALADAIAEPDNSFYAAHMEECEYINRSYYTNGEDGYAEVYSAPDGLRDAVIPNGTLLLVEWSYDGSWAYVTYDAETLQNDPDGEDGWIQLSQLQLKYDSESFFEEHGSEIREEPRTLTLEKNGSLVTWTYPGSGELSQAISDYGGEGDELEFDSIYTDSAGRDWGYLGYYYGHVEAWVCLSDPTNTELEPDENYREPDLIQAAGEDALAEAQQGVGRTELLVIVCCVAVVIIAAGILVYMKKRRAGRG